MDTPSASWNILLTLRIRSGTNRLGLPVLRDSDLGHSLSTRGSWAWYALWLVPLITVLEIIVNFESPPLVLVFVMSLLGLLLPVRKFFQGRQC